MSGGDTQRRPPPALHGAFSSLGRQSIQWCLRELHPHWAQRTRGSGLPAPPSCPLSLPLLAASGHFTPGPRHVRGARHGPAFFGELEFLGFPLQGHRDSGAPPALTPLPPALATTALLVEPQPGLSPHFPEARLPSRELVLRSASFTPTPSPPPHASRAPVPVPCPHERTGLVSLSLPGSFHVFTAILSPGPRVRCRQGPPPHLYNPGLPSG